MTESAPAALLGRKDELHAIDRVLQSAREGFGRALVIRGDVGIGKTALLEFAIAAALGMQILRVGGIASEMEIQFAALHQLVTPLLPGVPKLPALQRDALSSAFGLGTDGAPDRLHVGLGLLSMLSSAAARQPVACVIDDADCLDDASAEVLGLVARRVSHEPVGLVFAVIDGGAKTSFAGLPQMYLGGLTDHASRELLAGVVPGALADHVRERMVAEAYGNPLALLELADDLTAAQLAGLSVLPRSLPLGAKLELAIMVRVRRLPAEAQLFALLAAAEPDGDGDVIWRAAAELGLAYDAAAPAEVAGLLRTGRRVTFFSPLTRAVVYDSARGEDRRRVHQALAAATDEALEPDSRAWHDAIAAPAPDEDVAAALERSAASVRKQPGYATPAVLLELAARLTPDAHRRAERSLAAVGEELAGGGAQRASAMLTDSVLTDDFQRARGERLRIAIGIEEGTVDDAVQPLVDIAVGLESFDARLARDAHLDALVAAVYAGRFGQEGATAAVARITQAAPRVPPDEETTGDLLLDGLALRFTHKCSDAQPLLRRALERLRTDDNPTWLRLGCHAACELWDDEALNDLTARRVQLARATGRLFALRRALNARGAIYEVLVGRFDAAELLLEEAREIAVATRNPRADDRSNPGRLILAAWRGNETEARALAETTIREAAARGDGVEISFANYALGVLELGLGSYGAALRRATEVMDNEVVWVTTWVLPDLVEAAARNNRPDDGAKALSRLAKSAEACGTEWALGMLARSRALVAENRDAKALYEEAADHLGRSRSTPQLARARLVYGEWLRRSRRRKDARVQLRAAFEMFSAMGANAFAERARNELAATGEHARRWTAETMHLLTAQEARIARLVAEGAANAEIAAQLFISPRTVEYHLGKVFRKLDVSSRTQLARVLLEREAPERTEVGESGVTD